MQGTDNTLHYCNSTYHSSIGAHFSGGRSVEPALKHLAVSGCRIQCCSCVLCLPLTHTYSSLSSGFCVFAACLRLWLSINSLSGQDCAKARSAVLGVG